MSVEAKRLTTGGGFSEEALNVLSRSRGEPEWLLEMRLEAWRAFERMPAPSRKEEEWRRTDLSALDLEAVTPFAEPSAVASRWDELSAELRSELNETAPRSGLLVHHNSAGSYRSLSEEAAAKGVILADLDVAVREHPDLVRRHLGSVVAPHEARFTALHYAFWSGGTFLYVPQNVEVELPIQTLTWADRSGLAVMPHTLVVVEPGANVVFVDEVASPEDRGPALANSVVELSLSAGARARYVALQRWGRSVFSLGTQRALQQRDSQLTALSLVLGSKLTKSWVESRLAEPGASVSMVGIMFADGDQRFHHHTLQDHLAPNTTSDLLYKAALADRARSEYSGMIRVHKDAQRTDAYQANRNLVLSEHARADSMPKLEIEANDVRCTHGATVGPIDEEQVFYLMARGLPREAAERMIVRGFFEPVMERIPLETVKERIREAIDAKLGR
ncbi:MAG: Fe-S cluster assembly protein SufD [Sphingomonadaceae bacterium]